MKNILRHGDYKILRAVMERGEDSIYALSIDDGIIMGNSNIKQSVDRLVNYNYLKKGQEVDRGKIPLSLTDEGEDAVKKIKEYSLPNGFNDFTEHLYYRIAKKDGNTQFYPIFHGTLPPNYKVSEVS